MNPNLGLPYGYEASKSKLIKGGGKLEKNSFNPSYDIRIFEHVFGKNKETSKMIDFPKETKRKTQKKR